MSNKFFLLLIILFSTGTRFAFSEEISEAEVKKYHFKGKASLNPIHGTQHEKSQVTNGDTSLFKDRDIMLTTDSVLITPKLEFDYQNGFFLTASSSFSLSHTGKKGKHQETSRFSGNDGSDADVRTSFETKNDVKIYSLKSGFKFEYREYYLSLEPHVGFDYQNYLYKLGRFEREYPNTNFSNHQGIARDNITYETTYYIPYVGGEVAFITDTWKVGLNTRFAPRIISKVEEQEIMRDEFSKTELNGALYGFGLDIDKRIGEDFNIGSFYDYQITKIKGDGEHTSRKTGKSVPISQNISHKHFRVGIEAGYRF